MNMQLALGKLTEAVDGLKAKQIEQGKKLDGISHKVYAAVAILLLFGGIITFFAKSVNDAITNRLLTPTIVQQPSPTPIPSPTAIPTASRNH